MNVNIDINKAAFNIHQFVREQGGETQRSKVLELLAKICGFDCYRALKAAEDAQKSAPPNQLQGQIRQSTAVPVEGRLLEDASRVVYRSTAVDWEVAESSAEDLAEFPEYRRQQYDFLVESFGPQFRVMLKPQGVGLDNFEGKPLLDMLVEINDGVPCVHLTNDPADAMLLTVFATGEGILARQDDGEWVRADYGLPEGLEGLVSRNCDVNELHQARVCLLDTREKYERTAPPNVTPPVISSTEKLQEPVDKRFAGTAVRAALQKMFSDQYLMMTVALVDESGKETDLGQEDCPFPGPSSFETVIPLATGMASLQLHVECAAKIAAYLIAGRVGVAETATLLRKLTNCAPNDPLSPMHMAMREVRGGTDALSVYRRLTNYVCTID